MRPIDSIVGMQMLVTEVPKDQWIEFLDAFSRRHQRWLVTVESHRIGEEPHLLARERPLNGVVADRNRDGVTGISILLGGGMHFGHTVPSPRALKLEHTSEWADKALTI